MKPAYQDSFATLYIADALSGLAELPEKSVHMCVTSPPYFGLRAYLDKDHPDKGRELGTEATPEEFVAKLVEVMRGVWRVLRDDGTLWMVIGDSYAGSWSGTSVRPDGGSQRTGKPGFQSRAAAKGQYAERHGEVPAGLKPKDLIMIPARVALALQADGWYLRSEITWAKAVPMPESVTDRPTSATEKVFLLSKKASYFYDSEAVKERDGGKASGNGFKRPHRLSYGDRGQEEQWEPGGGRNQRNFWLLGPAPFPGSHFATFVPEIPIRCIRAGTSERGVCGDCGAPWRRVVESTKYKPEVVAPGVRNVDESRGDKTRKLSGKEWRETARTHTVGWEPTCQHDAEAPPVPATVLDPFAGSGRTLQAARKLGRRSIGFDLDERSTRHLEVLMGAQDVLL